MWKESRLDSLESRTKVLLRRLETLRQLFPSRKEVVAAFATPIKKELKDIEEEWDEIWDLR